MSTSRLIAGMAAACLLAASPVAARTFPGGGGAGISRPAVAAGAAALARNRSYGNYDGWGTVTIIPSPSAFMGSPVKTQEAPQNVLMQRGIQNTLLSQAQAQTSGLMSERQGNRDWWFQYQAGQMAESRARQSGSLSAGLGVEAVDPPPKAAMDVIQWPPLLQQAAFASRRAQIEAPYRRSPPALSTPAASDYRDMVKTVQEMKDMLEWLTRSGVDTREYEQAKAFLDRIGQQALERSEPGGAPPKTKS